MPTTIVAPKTKTAAAAEKDFLPLQGTDYIEFYVGNAKQAAHFYKTAFGFQSLAYSGPETGTKDRASYAIRQNKLTLVLTTPLRPNPYVADHHHQHGDGVKVLALTVGDATSAWEETTKRGGKSYMEPKTLKDDDGEVVMSGIHTYGEVVHLFIERQNYHGPFMQGFRKWESHYNPPQTGLQYVDQDLEPLKRLGILVDRDNEGYLLQIFTKPVEDRPTLFFEIIQRKGAKSFGKGNFKALFEALEREQEARGNL